MEEKRGSTNMKSKRQWKIRGVLAVYSLDTKYLDVSLQFQYIKPGPQYVSNRKPTIICLSH